MTAAITIHFRKPELTSRCVDSLLDDGWEPIVVWDNSDDGGVSLKILQDRYAAEPRAWLVGTSGNLGFGKGMNAALSALGQRGYKGSVLLINNDAELMPGARAAMEAQLSTSEETALIALRLMQNGHEQGWLYYQPWLALVTHRPLPGSFAYLSGCCMLIQRQDNAQPLFDEDFFMYGEDVELSWRMRREGARILLLDQSYVQHQGAASSGQASAAYERFLVQSHWLLAEKLSSNAASRMLMRSLRVSSLLARACVRSWRYRSWVPLRALFWI